MDSAVVGRVLALGQTAVLLHAGLGDELGVLVGDAVSAFVVGLGIVRRPPVAQISVLVELAPLVVVSVYGLVPNHCACSRIVDGVVLGGIEERRLQNSGWKVDGVGLGILVGIDRRRGHSPLGPVERLTNLLELAIHFKCRGTLHVAQMIVRLDFQSRIVAPVVGISDFVNLGG